MKRGTLKSNVDFPIIEAFSNARSSHHPVQQVWSVWKCTRLKSLESSNEPEKYKFAALTSRVVRIPTAWWENGGRPDPAAAVSSASIFLGVILTVAAKKVEYKKEPPFTPWCNAPNAHNNNVSIFFAGWTAKSIFLPDWTLDKLEGVARKIEHPLLLYTHVYITFSWYKYICARGGEIASRIPGADYVRCYGFFQCSHRPWGLLRSRLDLGFLRVHQLFNYVILRARGHPAEARGCPTMFILAEANRELDSA